MSIRTVSASSQYLLNTVPPVSAYPYTLGLWACPNSAAAMTAFGFGLNSAANNWCDIGTDTTPFNWLLPCGVGASFQNADSGIASVVGRWDFIVARMISATNRRISVLTSTGTIGHGQSTTSLTPSIDRLTIGGFTGGGSTSEFWDGWLAECWVLDADPQADGGQLSEPTLWQLAYGGPFSIPHIARNIVDYRSLRASLGSDQDKGDEIFYGSKGRQTWTSSGSPTLGAHPPLPYWYRNPRDTITSVMV